MAFPVSPTNGQITVVNNVSYQFSNVGNTWTRILSTANIISANIVSANTLNINNAFTAPSLSTTGNVTGNYILGNGALLTGVVTSVANINSGNSNVSIASAGANVTIGVGSVANVAVFAPDGAYINGVLSVTGNSTLTSVSTGNISAGNLTTGGLISAGGNIIGTLFIGNGAGLTNINASNIVGGYGNANVVANLASLGTNPVSTTGNVTAGYFIGNGSQLSGLPATYGNANMVANLAALGSNPVSTTGNVTGGNFLTGGLISATGNITGGNITIPGSANISTFIGNVFFGSVPAQPTWYTIAPLNLNNSLAAATKVQLNLINTGGGAGAGSAIDFYTYQISVAAANAEARIAGIDDGNYSAYLSLQTKTPGSTGTNGLVERVKIDSTGVSVVGNVTGGNLRTAGLISATGAITGAAITGSSLTVSTGNITVGNIVNANGNGVGNIGSATTYFNTVFAKATSAQYADLAELYAADANYAPGTVLDFGGANEVTLSSVASSARVAGVVSTNPAHLMNGMIQDKMTAPVALQGRVPTSVTGSVRKGDMMVSAGNGFAQACSAPSMGTVIGKALEDFDGASGTIEIVVGRL